MAAGHRHGCLCAVRATGTRVVDQALHTVRNAATRQTALVLCGHGDMVSLARAVHRHEFAAERPFIVCDPRRKQSDENVRAAENYHSGAEALQAARSGSLCRLVVARGRGRR